MGHLIQGNRDTIDSTFDFDKGICQGLSAFHSGCPGEREGIFPNCISNFFQNLDPSIRG